MKSRWGRVSQVLLVSILVGVLAALFSYRAVFADRVKVSVAKAYRNGDILLKVTADKSRCGQGVFWWVDDERSGKIVPFQTVIQDGGKAYMRYTPFRRKSSVMRRDAWIFAGVGSNGPVSVGAYRYTTRLIPQKTYPNKEYRYGSPR